jgi:hypothetical protein
VPVKDLPPLDIVLPDPESEIKRATEEDFHGTSGRIRGDCHTPSPLVPAFPLIVPFHAALPSPRPLPQRQGSSGGCMGISTNGWRARNVSQFGMAGLDDVFGTDD